MSPVVLRYGLIAFAIYMVLKTATAPKRGAFLTLFGNIRPETNPIGFKVCLIAGYALAVVMLLAAVFQDSWLPTILSLQTI